ncbi:hypothetical protein PF010_g17004 [Phytophthora fragariae]|uniref:PiggyBac transposable element-derived protein 4 C-terminal zinc-ribbon domain-containing protein n=1 Tax=Phytophthora fragariae TaxID=53985 RepID=A0A6G0KQ40_9STRA|nr:hypothetical protein PF010_g17004 [Phytophthora fragariae]
MPARRETRSETEAFQARLAGRSATERQRIAAEHRAFIDGEKDDDADFGDAQPAQARAVAQEGGGYVKKADGFLRCFALRDYARQAEKKQRGEPAPDHAEFLQELQAQLLQVTSADLIDESPKPAPSNPSGQGQSRHKLVEFPEWVQIREGVRKRPQHQCKVCSIRKKKVGERRATRFYYCETCSEGNRRVYLSDRIRPEHYPGNRLTCHQIWHDMWKNGEERPPPRVGRDIQMRALGKKRRGSRVQDAGSGEAPEHEDEAKQAEQEEEDEEAEKEDEVEQEDEEAEKEDEQQE